MSFIPCLSDELAQTLTLEVQGMRETSEIENHKSGKDGEEKRDLGFGEKGVLRLEGRGEREKKEMGR